MREPMYHFGDSGGGRAIRCWDHASLAVSRFAVAPMNATETPPDVSERPRWRQPAEWEPHAACWLAWPSHAELWKSNLGPAQAELTALARAIGDGERLEVLVLDAAGEASARAALDGLEVRFHRIPFGDIWLRDIGPIFVADGDGELAAASFVFNGWGGKYHLPGDTEVAAEVGRAAAVPLHEHPFVLEGGAIEVDGLGTALTTRECLLNPNRNPGWSAEDWRRPLRQALGIEHLVWLERGLANDHTDGHIDTLARFVAPGVVVAMTARDPGDPNREALDEIARDLAASHDVRGRRLEVVTVPSPGEVRDADGVLMPASYLNFYIANRTVAVPTYGSPHDEAAVAALAACFPGRRTVGLSAKAILAGGGAFHCISQQQPTRSRSDTRRRG